MTFRENTMNDNQPTDEIDRRTALSLLAGATAGGLILSGSSARAAESLAENDEILQVGKFPAQPGNYLAGELVTVDAINRRGGLRLDGDFNDDRYDKAQPHEFAMLPYGMIYYHGAPAELRDIPLGTHLNGSFYLPSAGEEKTIPPTLGPPQYGSKYNHAVLLEDDFSFYSRRGQEWKVVSIDKKALTGRQDGYPSYQPGRLKVVAVGKNAENGLNGEHTLWINESARVWSGRTLLDWDALAKDQVVQLNLTWCPDWSVREFGVSDVWIDKESQAAATEMQRRIHVRYQRNRWLPGWIDHVEHETGGRGIVTITLFGGMDESLYDEIKAKDRPLSVAAAENTLRTYWKDHDCMSGGIIDIKLIENPPLGSSGIEIRWKAGALLDGFRPGRIVRLNKDGWPKVKNPPEERLR
jgi:hypothetical protein